MQIHFVVAFWHSNDILMNIHAQAGLTLWHRRVSKQAQGRFYGGQGAAPNEKCGPQWLPILAQPASLDFYLNRPVISLNQLQNTPVISLIQRHIVPPDGIVPPLAPIRLVPEPPLSKRVPSGSNSTFCNVLVMKIFVRPSLHAYVNMPFWLSSKLLKIAILSGGKFHIRW